MNNNDNWERDYTIEGEEPEKPSKHPFAREFFTKYAYDSVKMFVDQIAIAIFGLMVSMALAKSSDKAMIGSSIFAVVFYLFLIYLVGWQQGAKDRISIDLGKKNFNIAIPILTTLLANSFNFVFAILYTVGDILNVDGIKAVGKTGAFLIEGMYTGILGTVVSDNADPAKIIYLRDFWYIYFLIILPAILVGIIAYVLGTKNKKLTNILTPQMPSSDRPGRK